MLEVAIMVTAALITGGIAGYFLRKTVARWEAEDAYYDRWEFGGWADEVSEPADEATRR